MFHPMNSFQSKLYYSKHRKQLSQIINTKTSQSKKQPQFNLKRSKDKSLSFHNKQKEQSINYKNQKLLHKILSISNRKRSQLQARYLPIKMTNFNNPARKRQKRFITISNNQLAERLINVPSTINIKTIVKEMDEYEKLKKSLVRNRRVLYSSLHLSSIKKSTQKKEESYDKYNAKSNQQ